MSGRFVLISGLAVTMLACGGKTPSGTSANGDSTPTGDSDTTTNNNNRGSLTATIVRPNGNVSILSGTEITFEAEFIFDGVRITPPSVSWSAGLFLGGGNPLLDQTLPVGVHTVTVTGVYEGSTATDLVTVTVGNLAVRIRNPISANIEDAGSNVGFRGEAFVLDGGTVELVSAGAAASQRNASYEWSSSIDGVFGNQDQFQFDQLSVGAHEITLTVTDDDPTAGTGQSGSATVSLTVAPPNTSPTVAITEPASCPVDLEQGATLTLQGSVTDPDPADAGLTGGWIDSVSGHTRDGASYLFGPGAVLGKHQIIFSATDNRGVRDSAVCDVYVIEAGGARADLFPDTAQVNNYLVGGNDNVNWIGADPDGNTWIGNDRGITMFDAGDHQLGVVDGDALFPGVGPSEVNVLGVAFAGDSAFIATDEGLAQCNYAAGSLSDCSKLIDQNFDSVTAAGDPAANGFVAGASEAGLFVARFVAGSPTPVGFTEGNSNLPSTEVADVAFLGDALYIATNGGLCVSEDLSGAVGNTAELCASFLTEPSSLLPDNEICTLAVAGNDLWIGTSDGLVRYTPATGAMALYDRSSGLGNDNINDIAVDANGVVWVATNGGVSRLVPSTNAITNLTGVDFGTPAENRVNSVFIDGNGTKWFGTNNGVVRYDGA